MLLRLHVGIDLLRARKSSRMSILQSQQQTPYQILKQVPDAVKN